MGSRTLARPNCRDPRSADALATVDVVDIIDDRHAERDVSATVDAPSKDVAPSANFAVHIRDLT
jgi:hypothetical protein